MKIKNKSRYLVIIILGLSLFLGILTRFYKLGDIPKGLYLDEAAQGYNAFSILKTGKDEFGKSYPFVFRSFTDFKTPVYIYLIVPLIPIFGLTKFTVRFPSFFFSILSLPIIYFLMQKLSPKKMKPTLALLITLLLSISPWHILFGRTNFECNVALFFFISGVYFFYKGLNKPIHLVISSIFFSIATQAYHAQRIVTPLFVLALFIRYRKTLLSKIHLRYTVLGIIIGAIILLPTLSIATTNGFLARAKGLNIFTHERQEPYGYVENCNYVFCPIFNNSLFLTTKEFISLYISYFSPRNMFILGDYGPRSSFPELSTFFIWQFPFYLYGLYTLIRDKKLMELRFFTLTLLLISPIPAAVTRDPYSSIRSLQMVIPILILISLGLLKFYYYLKNTLVPKIINLKLYKSLIFFTLIFIVIYSLGRLYSSIIILNEKFRAIEWNYGWEEVVFNLKNLDHKYPIIVDNARSEPYSQLLFFLKFDPSTYQKDNFEISNEDYYINMNRNKTKKIGNIITRQINWKNDLSVEQYLIGDELSISNEQITRHKLTLLKEVLYPDGSVAFRIVKTNP